MAATLVLSRRQEIPVYRDGLDDIGIAELLQGLADMAMLPAWFSSTGGFPLFFPERVRRRRFAAVPTVESKTVDQDGDQQEENFKAAFERRGEIFLLGDQGCDPFYRIIHIDIVHRHEKLPCSSLSHYNTGF
jgi:hypothetical protein